MPRRLPVHERVQRQRGRKAVATRDRRLRRTNYLCEMCQAQGVVRVATVVDHIKPLALGGDDSDENTRNLCAEHDLEMTAEQFGYRARPRIGEDGWPLES